MWTSTFASGIITLYVGLERAELQAHAATLRQLDFFRARLDAAFHKGSSRTIDLPDGDLQAMNVLLQFSYSKPFQRPVDLVNKLVVDNIKLALQTYIMANRYSYIELTDAITQMYRMCDNRIFVEVADIELFGQAGLEDTPLYQFMVRKLAYDLQDKGWQRYITEIDSSIVMQLVDYPGPWLAVTEALCTKWVRRSGRLAQYMALRESNNDEDLD